MNLYVACPKCSKLLLTVEKSPETERVVLKSPPEGVTFKLGDFSGLAGSVVCSCSGEAKVDLLPLV